jgi:hypothetical protein
MTDDDWPVIIWICQGEPLCQLKGDEAIEAQRAECVWCDRMIVEEDGSSTTIKPSSV